MKIPVVVGKRLDILLIIFLDDIILIARSIKETLTARDTLIYLLQGLGLCINVQKLVLKPAQTLQILMVNVVSTTMVLSK